MWSATYTSKTKTCDGFCIARDNAGTSMSFKRPASLFSDQFDISPWSEGDSRTSVKPDPATSACSMWQVATYILLSSSGPPLANALPHSLHPRRIPVARSLLSVALRPFRVYFFSVNDVPRDNGTAGACRNRHHGGGKMAHAALREAASVRNYKRDINSYYRRQFLRSFIASLSL